MYRLMRKLSNSSYVPEGNRGCGDGSTVDENAVSKISAKDVELASTDVAVDSP